MQTRRLAIAQDDPKVTKVVKLAQILRDIYLQIMAVEDDMEKLQSQFFKDLPSKKKDAAYFDSIQEPIDLNTIERNINTGSYTDPDQFDKDLLKLFQNNLRFYGHYSEEGQAALNLRKAYLNIRPDFLAPLQELLGPDLPFTSGFRYKKPDAGLASNAANNEDIISCPWGLVKIWPRRNH